MRFFNFIRTRRESECRYVLKAKFVSFLDLWRSESCLHYGDWKKDCVTSPLPVFLLLGCLYFDVMILKYAK